MFKPIYYNELNYIVYSHIFLMYIKNIKPNYNHKRQKKNMSISTMRIFNKL